jgi:predicted transcriptional regulator
VFLVELEKQVMQYHWSSPNIDAKQLHTAIIATNKETNADDYPSRL